MNSQDFFTPHKMEKNSFLWAEARLVIAALSLLIGGYPIIWYILPVVGLYGLISTLLTICWLVSGLTSGYLLYRWYEGGQKVFGGKKQADVAAFLVAGVSGINLGLAGLFKKNIGMSILSGRLIFAVVGLLYLWTAYHLYQRWNEHGRKMF